MCIKEEFERIKKENELLLKENKLWIEIDKNNDKIIACSSAIWFCFGFLAASLINYFLLR